MGLPAALRWDVLPEGMSVHRVHWTTIDPLSFSVGKANRFDAPGGEFGVLYTAADIEGAFVETVLRRNGRLIRRDVVGQRSWVRLELTRALRVVRLHGEGLLWHGQDATISTSSDYRLARALSLALFNRADAPDGIAYRSKHDNDQICYAFYDRVLTTAFKHVVGASFSEDWTATTRLVSRYGAYWDRTTRP